MALKANKLFPINHCHGQLVIVMKLMKMNVLVHKPVKIIVHLISCILRVLKCK